MKTALLTLIFCALSHDIFCWASDEVIFDPLQYGNESGLRALISKVEPKLRASFYYFDGSQVFGIFTKSDSDKIFLVAAPDGRVEKLNALVEGSKIKLRVDPLSVKIGAINASTGKADYSNTMTMPLGVWVKVPIEGKVEIEMTIHQSYGKYMLSAKRDRGRWKGEMLKKPSVKDKEE